MLVRLSKYKDVYICKQIPAKRVWSKDAFFSTLHEINKSYKIGVNLVTSEKFSGFSPTII